MTKRTWLAMATLFAAVLALTLAGRPAPAAKAAPGKDVFDPTKLWKIHLEISAKEWEAMQPKGGWRFPVWSGGPGQPGKTAEKPPEKPPEPAGDRHKSVFGMEFLWVHGQITADGQTYKNVGLRFKGNSSYAMAARGPKRPLKLKFDRYNDRLSFHGLKTINLNNNAMDTAQLREALSYAVFRAAGVPAPRTAFAEVTLTVPGKYDKEYLGLYTLVEQVDRIFLKDRFRTSKGLLMKPERMRGIDYFGDDWEKYKNRYQPKQDASKKESRRVIAFAKLVNQADDEQFRKEIGSYLDLDEFLHYLAVNALLVNLDSYVGLGHNYYLYLHPETNKFMFIPWDLNLSLAGMMMGGTADQQMDLSINHPYWGQNKLIDRLLAIKEINASYQKVLRELAATCFTKEKLLQDIAAMQKATGPIIARETKTTAARKEGQEFGPGMFGRSPSLEQFVDKRVASVAAQLAGKSKGHVPTMSFGGMNNFWAKPLLTALDTNKDGKVTKEEALAGATKFFQDCDKDKKGAIDEKTLAEGLNRLFPRPPNFGVRGGGPGNPPPGGPGGGRPGGPGRPGGGPGRGPFPGPGAMVAGVIVKRTGTDKDGKVTRDRFVSATEALFAECDKDKNGSLNEKEMGTAIGLLFPPWPGPPGGRPAEPKKMVQTEEKKP